MTISHPDAETIEPDRGFIFAELLGTFCSVCAPAAWTAEDVEDFTVAGMGTDGWRAIDKSKMGLGSPTPNPCNQYPDRKHWFMVRNP